MVKMTPKGKKVKGCDYAEVDEEYEKKRKKKEMDDMKTSGMAKKLQKSEKEEGYSKKPRVKGQKKDMKPVSGQKKVY